MRKTIASTLALTCSLLGLVVTKPAAAFGWNAHRRLVHAATAVMHNAATYSDYATKYPRPTDIGDATSWNQYLAALKVAHTNLAGLQTGLPDITLDTTPCNYDSRLNVKHLSTAQIKDLPYLPQGGNLNSCAELSKPPAVNGDTNQQWRALGYVLGWHAFQVDNEPKDTVLWFKPTSAFFGAIPNEVSGEVIHYVGGTILLPFSIILSLFTGVEWDYSYDFAQDYLNPTDYLDYLESELIGYGYLHEPSYNGLWHFIDPDSTGGDYNQLPGMCYAHAGPTGVPAGVDFAMVLAGDIAGLSYSTKSSVGHERYGHYDDESRPATKWAAGTIADLEFSPVDNLAQWGWNNYLQNPTSAKMLGWPLHALGDAAEAQHLANTSGWGHTEMEDAIDRSIDDAIGYDATIDNFFDAQYGSTRPKNNSEYNVLRDGYYWWLAYKDGDINIENMVESGAWQNRQFFNGSGAYFYNVTGYTSEDFTNRTYNFNRSFFDVVRPPAEFSTGAMVALLIRAGEKATPVVDPAALCPAGTAYSPSLGACTGEPDQWCASSAVVDWSQIPKQCSGEGASIPLSVTATCDETGWFKLKNLHALTSRGATGLKIWLSPYLNDTVISSSSCLGGNMKCENYYASLDVYGAAQGSTPIAVVPPSYAIWTATELCAGTGTSGFLLDPPCDSNVAITIPNTSSNPIPDTFLVKAVQAYNPDRSDPYVIEWLLPPTGTLHVEAVGNNYSECSVIVN